MKHHPYDARNDPESMHYFTPELFVQLNSPDSKAVATAMAAWDKASEAYRNNLEKVRGELPAQSQPLTDLSLHDWNILGVWHDLGLAPPLAVISVRWNKDLIQLIYSLSKSVRKIIPPKDWPASQAPLHWLYDEFDIDYGNHRSFVHRILLSDGVTLVVPFTNCRVMRAKARAMSHSDLMEMAT